MVVIDSEIKHKDPNSVDAEQMSTWKISLDWSGAADYSPCVDDSPLLSPACDAAVAAVTAAAVGEGGAAARHAAFGEAAAAVSGVASEADVFVAELLNAFVRVVLPAHNCRHTQFIVFFVASLEVRWTVLLLQQLFMLLVNRARHIRLAAFTRDFDSADSPLALLRTVVESLCYGLCFWMGPLLQQGRLAFLLLPPFDISSVLLPLQPLLHLKRGIARQFVAACRRAAAAKALNPPSGAANLGGSSAAATAAAAATATHEQEEAATEDFLSPLSPTDMQQQVQQQQQIQIQMQQQQTQMQQHQHLLRHSQRFIASKYREWQQVESALQQQQHQQPQQHRQHQIRQVAILLEQLKQIQEQQHMQQDEQKPNQQYHVEQLAQQVLRLQQELRELLQQWNEKSSVSSSSYEDGVEGLAPEADAASGSCHLFVSAAASSPVSSFSPPFPLCEACRFEAFLFAWRAAITLEFKFSAASVYVQQAASCDKADAETRKLHEQQLSSQAEDRMRQQGGTEENRLHEKHDGEEIGIRALEDFVGFDCVEVTKEDWLQNVSQEDDDGPYFLLQRQQTKPLGEILEQSQEALSIPPASPTVSAASAPGKRHAEPLATADVAVEEAARTATERKHQRRKRRSSSSMTLHHHEEKQVKRQQRSDSEACGAEEKACPLPSGTDVHATVKLHGKRKASDSGSLTATALPRSSRGETVASGEALIPNARLLKRESRHRQRLYELQQQQNLEHLLLLQRQSAAAGQQRSLQQSSALNAGGYAVSVVGSPAALPVVVSLESACAIPAAESDGEIAAFEASGFTPLHELHARMLHEQPYQDEDAERALLLLQLQQQEEQQSAIHGVSAARGTDGEDFTEEEAKTDGEEASLSPSRSLASIQHADSGGSLSQGSRLQKRCFSDGVRLAFEKPQNFDASCVADTDAGGANAGLSGLPSPIPTDSKPPHVDVMLVQHSFDAEQQLEGPLKQPLRGQLQTESLLQRAKKHKRQRDTAAQEVALAAASGEAFAASSRGSKASALRRVSHGEVTPPQKYPKSAAADEAIEKAAAAAAALSQHKKRRKKKLSKTPLQQYVQT
ncbi:hypothetical protein cyc_00098 [Cyclospora cayetanensis]|uniref:Uncharacterized protein n=1 Tax=Cyclospora cayetanensis TaxID=88456 RepID=A0A1D3D9Z2_9EIME|nr:hypothetical protein cyc_00098 [Cyclospora cayetanensis]